MSIYMDTAFTVYCCFLAAVLGAALGSFLNCAAWRISRGESFVKGHSRCPSCGNRLKAADLVPILSWVFLGGKCRYCKAKVSVRYPLTEAFFALLTVLALLKFDLSVSFLRNLVFFCCLFCLSLVDLESYIIPDGCLLFAAGAWLFAAPFAVLENGWWDGVFEKLIAAAVFGGGTLALSLVMDRVLKKESLGGGDVKLFAVTGLYLGIVGSLFGLVLASVLGLLFAAARKKKDKNESAQIPFAPAISLSACIMLLFGSGLVDWYLSLITI